LRNAMLGQPLSTPNAEEHGDDETTAAP